MNPITLRLLGVLQEWLQTATILLKVELPIQVSELKRLLVEKVKSQFTDEKQLILLAHCALADDRHIFTENEIITHAGDFAILPPFSGG